MHIQTKYENKNSFSNEVYADLCLKNIDFLEMLDELSCEYIANAKVEVNRIFLNETINNFDESISGPL